MNLCKWNMLLLCPSTHILQVGFPLFFHDQHDPLLDLHRDIAGPNYKLLYLHEWWWNKWPKLKKSFFVCVFMWNIVEGVFVSIVHNWEVNMYLCVPHDWGKVYLNVFPMIRRICIWVCPPSLVGVFECLHHDWEVYLSVFPMIGRCI